MEIPAKFIVGWLIIISVTYGVAGYVYGEELNVINYDPPEAEDSNIILDFISLLISAGAWFVNTLVALFRVFFFVLPNVPPIVTTILNFVFVPLNIIFFLGIYPFIRDIAMLVIETAKATAQYLDAIIPF